VKVVMTQHMLCIPYYCLRAMGLHSKCLPPYTLHRAIVKGRAKVVHYIGNSEPFRCSHGELF
jgi:hypothetical protein